MSKTPAEKLMRICAVVFVGALAVFLISSYLLFRNSAEQAQNALAESKEKSPDTELSDGLVFYPDKAEIGQSLRSVAFYDENGKESTIGDFDGQFSIILFWASWCKYCKKEFISFDAYAEALSRYKNVELILLDKLDGKKETVEKAVKYLKDNGIYAKTYFDRDLRAYDGLGIKIVPTLLAVGKDGSLVAIRPGEIGSPERFEALLRYLTEGAANRTEQFITERMTDSDGGVYVNYLDGDDGTPAGHDVLSESQGLMMEYAVRTENRALFDRTYRYVEDHMLIDGKLAGWVLSKDGLSKSNALIDDFRIVRALYAADQHWGGYKEALLLWTDCLIKYNLGTAGPTNSYDFGMKRKSDQLKLCFADFEAMRILQAQRPDDNRLEKAYNEALEIVKGGYRGDTFPVYAGTYSYKSKKYAEEDINMAEGMMTLLHLARVGELQDTTVRWLKEHLKNGGIQAGYTWKGGESDRYNYESTAVYAAAVMIAEELGDREMLTDALYRMERLRIDDVSSPLDGSFGDGKEEDIYSFDQCMALLAYTYIHSIK